ncbi:MAG TPA: ABC transporter permease [Thermoplasmata archaeon]|jgi:ABC-2 type transport system permease protein|nr:ABC transporter permease [Thermoplasmata archaeon]HIH28322.1 ABC transporter permease [Thermoplasmata archaeon]
MNLKIVGTDFLYSIRSWTRSRGTVFWSLLFPVMLILLFGAIFSGMGESKYTLYVQDLDNTDMSHSLVTILNKTNVLNIKNVTKNDDITKYIKDNNIKNLIVIPEGYENDITRSFSDPSAKVNITYYFDPTETQTNQILRSVISSVLEGLNMQLTQGKTIIGLTEQSTVTENFGFIDFFIPGMIGFTIMQQSIYGSIERNTKFRKDGILRKLLTTPITRSEWILAKMLFMLFLAFISTSVAIGVGVLAFGIKVNINLLTIIIVIATSFLFSGIGMIIGRFVKEEETADMAAGAISFPMMFLAGTFFAVESMPSIIQIIARALPLYYVNEGLRNAMIYMNQTEALINGGIVLIFAAIFFIAGVILTKWKED